MGHKVDLMLLEELCGKGPGSVPHHLINITAVPQGIIAFVFCHHCIALKLVGEFITADSYYQVCVGENIFCLHQSSSVPRMEKIKDPISVDSHWTMSWCAPPCLGNCQLFMLDV